MPPSALSARRRGRSQTKVNHSVGPHRPDLPSEWRETFLVLLEFLITINIHGASLDAVVIEVIRYRAHPASARYDMSTAWVRG